MRALLIVTCIAALATGCASSMTNNAAGHQPAAPATATAPANVVDLTWSQVEEALNAGAVLVDARVATEFAEGHIDGAVNTVPASTDVQVIFYASGPTTDLAAKAAREAANKGFSKVAEYSGGYAGWLMQM